MWAGELPPRAAARSSQPSRRPPLVVAPLQADEAAEASVSPHTWRWTAHDSSADPVAEPVHPRVNPDVTHIDKRIYPENTKHTLRLLKQTEACRSPIQRARRRQILDRGALEKASTCTVNSLGAVPFRTSGSAWRRRPRPVFGLSTPWRRGHTHPGGQSRSFRRSAPPSTCSVAWSPSNSRSVWAPASS